MSFLGNPFGGLPGYVSRRIFHKPQRVLDRPQQIPPAASTFQPPHLSSSQEPPFTLPVRWQGRLYSVRLPSTHQVAFGELPTLLLARLCPNRYSLAQCDAPLIHFNGCSPDRSPGPPRISRLRVSHEPKSWEDLARLKHQGGFVEIQLRCRGGSDTGQNTLPTYVPPSYRDDLDWDAVSAALGTLAGGNPLTVSAATPEVCQLARHLHQYIPTGQYQALCNWPDGYDHLTPARLTALFDLVRRYTPAPGLPEWYRPSTWVDVRINSLPVEALGLSAQQLGSKPSPERLHASLLALLQDKVPELRLLRLDPSQPDVWQCLESNVSIRCNPSQSRFLSIVMLLPAESPESPWRSRLLSGVSRLSSHSYLTFNSSSTLIEAELRPSDAVILVAIAKTLCLPDNVYMSILAAAFSEAWGGAQVHCRYGCEIRSSNGNQRLVLADPGSTKCGIVVGASLATLLQANRSSRLTKLRLGALGQFPVSLLVEAPSIPKAALFDLMHSVDPALRLIPLEGSADPGLTESNIVIGPLPRRWLPSQSRSQDRVTQLAYLQRTQSALSSTSLSARFVSRPGEPPFALFLACPDTQTTSTLVVALRDDQSTQAQFESLLGFLPQAVFESKVPPECITLMGERGLRELLNPPGEGGQPPPHARA